MGAILKIVILIVVAVVAYKVHQIFQTPPLPKLEDTWWGPRDPSKEDTAIKPFKINISDQILNDLQTRLSKARRFAPPLEGIRHQYGINTNLLSSFVDFWRTKYNWREREKFLNQYPQFTVSVQGLQLHYLHVKPQNPENLPVLPLLLLHGWPGSVREFYEMIPLMTTPQPGRNFVFEVFIPSLPGYGFSEGAVRPGLGPMEMAVVFKNFMKRLGFERYYIQGGDWGGLITQHMATLYPDIILGVHSNMCFVNTPMSNLKLFLGSFWPSLIVEKEFQHKLYPLSNYYFNLILEMGYMHIQATKPDTVGVALNDSPVGLAAYILEKFITWTNPEWKKRPDGGITEKFTYTQILDNIMIYWVTGSITTSMRLYSEAFNKNQMSVGLDMIPTAAPSACSRFPNEIAFVPSSVLGDKYHNLVHVSDMPAGGHFAAFEEPKLLADEIYISVEKMIAASSAKK